MSNFDIVFIYKVLKEFNKLKNEEFYKMSCIFRDNKILKLTIKVKTNNKHKKYIKITLLDSFNILSNSLFNLAKDFKVKTQKGIFPYNFVNKNNLNYIGPTPDIKFYKNTTLENYKQHIFKPN